MNRENNQDKRTDNKDFPGYPHYPAKEDITQPANNNGKENMGYEEKNPPNKEQARSTENAKDNRTSDPNESEIVMGTDADVSEEDLEILDDGRDEIPSASLDRRDAEGDLLNEATDETGEELDVPGSEADDANEDIGEEDEENNYYSLGGDKDDDITTAGTP